MLDFGFSEIVLTSAIALIVLGPEKLPKVARQVGNWMGRARAMARQLTEQLEREVDAEELLKSKPKTGSAVPITSAPSPFDTSSFPTSTMTPIAATPPADQAPLAPSAPSDNSSGTYSADPAHSPNGADWHPSPRETQASNE
jgi:sec-independent protein translocase protein TatB